MMLAPDSTNLMAPTSALNFAIMSGYWCNKRRVGYHGPSLWAKNSGVPFNTTICTCSGLRVQGCQWCPCMQADSTFYTGLTA